MRLSSTLKEITRTPVKNMTIAKHIQAHILLVEDDELSSELLEKYLSQHGFEVTVLADGEQLEATLIQRVVNAIVLDILLPGENGLYWLSWLKRNYPTTPVLLCSQCSSAEERATGLSKGAADYIIKPYHPKEILVRLQNLLVKPRYSLLRIGTLLFDSQRALLTVDGQPDTDTIPLTLQEALLLQLLFQQPGKLLTRDDIAQWLNGSGHDPTRRSLDMLITRLRKKLGDSGEDTRYLHTVWGKGYRFTPEG